MSNDPTEIDKLYKALNENELKLEKTSNEIDSTSSDALDLFTYKTDIYDRTLYESLCLSGMIMIFSLLVIAFMTFIIRKGGPLEDTLKVFGTMMIIVAAVFLIVAGYSEKQIAPVIGLLGTIAGYLLGRSAGTTNRADSPPSPVRRGNPDTEQVKTDKT